MRRAPAAALVLLAAGPAAAGEDEPVTLASLGLLVEALSDAVIAFELPTIARTIWTYGRLTVRELRRGKI